MELTLSSEDLGIINWYVDASHAVHHDCHEQSGAMMTLGKGAVISFYRKQKLSAKSSTEAELIGVDDAIPQVLWTRYFIEDQGYTITEDVILQDNMSAMKLEVNGKASSSWKIKHINIRFFFIKDHIDNGEVSVKYCPTEYMWTDIFTKPLQGASFRKMRAMIMSCPEDYCEENSMKIKKIQECPCHTTNHKQ